MGASDTFPTTRQILRVVAVVVLSALALWLIYLARDPLSWIVIALFLAVAISGPVNWLARRMPRWAAIVLTYLLLFLIPAGIVALIVPPVVSQVAGFAEKAPAYARDLNDFVQRNPTFRKLDEKYDVTHKIEQEAGKLPGQIPNAASALGDFGVGLVSSLFALLNILILSIFMVASGPRWARAALRLLPPERAARLEPLGREIARTVGNYMAGAVGQAILAGLAALIVLEILGVPFAGALAVVMALGDLIPLVGATIAAVFIGVVTVFADFPTATIVWAIFAVVYQQVENSVIQPRIQSRAVAIEGFVVLVSVLVGGSLFGIVGALLAIPVAASAQIALREWWAFRRTLRAGAG